MKILGLTGGIASGKSTIAQILKEEHHLPIIDADHLAKAAVAAGSVGLKRIVRHFGEGYILENGEMDRKKMGELVRHNEKALRDLNAIVHPLVSDAFFTEKEKLNKEGHSLIVYDCPLLFEENLQHLVDVSLLVITDHKIRVARLMERDGILEGVANEKMAIQMTDVQKEPLADMVLYNNGNLEDLKNTVAQLVMDLKWKLLKIDALSF